MPRDLTPEEERDISLHPELSTIARVLRTPTPEDEEEKLKLLERKFAYLRHLARIADGEANVSNR